MLTMEANFTNWTRTMHVFLTQWQTLGNGNTWDGVVLCDNCSKIQSGSDTKWVSSFSMCKHDKGDWCLHHCWCCHHHSFGSHVDACTENRTTHPPWWVHHILFFGTHKTLNVGMNPSASGSLSLLKNFNCISFMSLWELHTAFHEEIFEFPWNLPLKFPLSTIFQHFLCTLPHCISWIVPSPTAPPWAQASSCPLSPSLLQFSFSLLPPEVFNLFLDIWDFQE